MLPSRPLLIFDGDCGFCRRWIRRWNDITGDTVDYESSKTASERFPQIGAQSFNQAVVLITPDGRICSGAEAIFRSLDLGGLRWPLILYKRFPGMKTISNVIYRIVAEHRRFFGALTDFFWGDSSQCSTFVFGRRILLVGLGLLFAVAFASFWSQARGLIGSQGILPMEPFFKSIREQVAFLDAIRLVPTVFWISHSDHFLTAVCFLGVVSSLLIISGRWTPFFLFVSWALYLSIVSVGREFMNFQWDVLILEVGFLAIFFANRGAPSRFIFLLFQWLLFRLMFGSGMVKWLSGDPTWHSASALEYHYFTQPLPTWIGWIFHHAPRWFHKASVIAVFAIEWVVPFLLFMPRRPRHVGAGLLFILQVLIFLTGNYCFFNLLSMLLCILMFDDRFWSPPIKLHAEGWRWSKSVLYLVGGVVLISSTLQFSQRLSVDHKWNIFFNRITSLTMPFHVTNSYGLFAVMTTQRPEIIVQGSNDGSVWEDYEFKHKPGNVFRRPQFVAPHQPRLDWQMWFAALGNYRQNPWFVNFCLRLLQGSPDVLKLLRHNPFPSAPPRYIRAVVYDYTYTSMGERRKTGAWWTRRELGIYLPTIVLKNDTPAS